MLLKLNCWSTMHKEKQWWIEQVQHPTKDDVQDKQKLKWATSANENLNKQQDIDKVERTIDDTMKHLQEHAQDKVKRWCCSWMKRSKLLNDEYAGLLCYDL
jgi:hypothetical protein